jgi:hypothetical protein
MTWITGRYDRCSILGYGRDISVRYQPDLPSPMDKQYFSRAIGHVNVKLKNDVSEVSSVSIIRVDVMNGRMSLIFILVCETDSFFWCIIQ